MALQFTRLQAEARLLQQKMHSLLWQQDFSVMPWWQRTLTRSMQILVAIVRDLAQGQLSLRAMSLVFTSVVGFFPLFALTFAVLKGFGVHNALEPTLLTLLEPLGERANEMTSQILNYVDNLQVQLIGVASLGFLIWIVLDMMHKIETAFNYIWAVKKGRSFTSRFSEYLFAVIVSPLLLFLSISITSYINTNFFTSFLEGLAIGSVILPVTAYITSILLMSLAFAFAYGFLPNTKVQFSSAFIGGLVTTLCWKLMGTVFQGFFISPLRENLYLAFASPIAIMFFLFIGWLVALVGSSIAFYHQNPGKARSGRTEPKLSIAQTEQATLATALAIIRQFNSGGRALSEHELLTELQISPVTLEKALDNLKSIGMISTTDDEPPRYLPSHAISNCSLVDIWEKLRDLDENQENAEANSRDIQTIEQFQEEINTLVEKQLGEKAFVDALKGNEDENETVNRIENESAEATS